MTEERADPAPAGVVVLESAISAIDGLTLRYRGVAIEELVAAASASSASYEDVAWLLWTGEAPTAADRATLFADLQTGAARAPAVWHALMALPQAGLPIAKLQVALPWLGQSLAELGDDTLPGTHRAALLLGAFVMLAGSAVRGRVETSPGWTPASDERPQPGKARGEAMHPPSGWQPDIPALIQRGVAATFLALARGDEPPEEHVRALERVLILYADHELNASTFAGRVAASTHADLVSCILAALCALRGPLHGGVDRLVRALLAAAEHEGVDSVLDRYRRAGAHLPGFGHSVYRGLDPRAVMMHDLARALAPAAGQVALLQLTEAIEATAARQGVPPANVDLYTVVVYRSLGIPDALSTLVFATGRLAGWCAHVLEQYERNRLIRPRAAYVGPGPRRWAGRG